ncbi:hypothetical protein ACV8VZ_25105, partial [Citrobacter freundii]
GKNSLNRLIRCVCGKKIGPDPRNFNQRVSLGRNDLLIRTFPKSTSSGSSEGSDPDPEAYSSLAFLFSFWSFLSLLISLLFVYACISIIEVVA